MEYKFPRTSSGTFPGAIIFLPGARGCLFVGGRMQKKLVTGHHKQTPPLRVKNDSSLIMHSQCWETFSHFLEMDTSVYFLPCHIGKHAKGVKEYNFVVRSLWLI